MFGAQISNFLGNNLSGLCLLLTEGPELCTHSYTNFNYIEFITCKIDCRRQEQDLFKSHPPQACFQAEHSATVYHWNLVNSDFKQSTKIC
jgi:hypothetical protein